MTTVAITGASGFMGGAIARALAAEGHHVIALTRPSSDRSWLTDVDVTWVEGDVLNPESLTPFIYGAEWLVHAAGMLGQAGIIESDYLDLHVQGTMNVLRIASDCRRVLYLSSPGVLGPIAGPPADETAVLAPSNAYERSKAAAEEMVLEFAADGMPIIIGRPEFVYGPGDRHVLGLFSAVQRGRFFYVDGGHHTCHPTYVSDAVDGLVRCLIKGRAGEIYHITGPRPVTFRELGETIASALGVSPPRWSLPRPIAWAGASVLEMAGRLLNFRPPLSRSGVAFFSEDRRFSSAKAFTELGYEPKHELASGVQLSIDWYRSQGLL